MGVSFLLLGDDSGFTIPGVWESDEELDDFLADLHASRRANTL